MTTPSAPPLLIEAQADFDRVIAELADEPLVAVDTEAASFHRYRDRVFLLQLSSRHLTAVVDPLAVADLSAFGRLLADPAIETVFHDADYDLRLLSRIYDFSGAGLFDTRIAAQLLNEPGIGLAALLKKYLDVELDKRFQRADWSARPLSEPMIAYAAMDTRHLPELRDILRDKLGEAGRLSWAEEEFTLLQDLRWVPPDAGEPAFLRIKGAKALRGRALGVLREVFAWREATAERLDRASFRVMGNEPMLAIAQAMPRDLDALRKIPGLGRDFADRRGRDLLEAVARGLAIPDKDLPRIERGGRRVLDADYEARLERLKVARNEAARRLDLAPGVACPNGTLEAIARACPTTVAQLAALPEIRRWQAEAMGEELLAAL